PRWAWSRCRCEDPRPAPLLPPPQPPWRIRIPISRSWIYELLEYKVGQQHSAASQPETFFVALKQAAVDQTPDRLGKPRPFPLGRRNPSRLAQSDEKTLFHRLCITEQLDVIHGRGPGSPSLDILPRRFHVRPAPQAVKRMRACPKAPIGLAAPVLQVVQRFMPRPGKIRNLVTVNTQRGEAGHGFRVEGGDLVIPGNGAGAVARSAAQDLAPQAAGLVGFQHVDRYVRRSQRLDP